MPVTTLDPTTALIAVDLQEGLAGPPPAHRLSDSVAHTAALADAFRATGLPVVLVSVAGTAPGRTEEGRTARDLPDGFTDLLPALGRQPGDKIVTKHTWGAFHGTDLADHLDELGVTQVVITGINSAAHDNSTRHIFPAPGEIGTTAEILALLSHITS